MSIYSAGWGAESIFHWDYQQGILNNKETACIYIYTHTYTYIYIYKYICTAFVNKNFVTIEEN
jgi:hypothetical protein